MNVYEIVTEKIINLLEQGVIPWRRPWTGGGLPRNVVSRKACPRDRRADNASLADMQRTGRDRRQFYRQIRHVMLRSLPGAQRPFCDPAPSLQEKLLNSTLLPVAQFGEPGFR